MEDDLTELELLNVQSFDHILVPYCWLMATFTLNICVGQTMFWSCRSINNFHRLGSIVVILHLFVCRDKPFPFG